MDLIKSGDDITVRHYSSIKSFQSTVVEIQQDKIEIQLAKDFILMGFLIGDPIVLGIEKDQKMHVIGCDINKIKSKEKRLELIVDKTEEEASQRRYQRVPVSLYSDLRSKFENKKCLGLIKDISHYGMLIYSKADFKVAEKIEIDIYMDKRMIFLKAEIMRKISKESYIQYGMRIIYEDVKAMHSMQEYLKEQEQKQIELLYIEK